MHNFTKNPGEISTTLNPWPPASIKIQSARKSNCFLAPSPPHSGCSNLPLYPQNLQPLSSSPCPLHRSHLHGEGKSQQLTVTKPVYLPVLLPKLTSFLPIGMTTGISLPREAKHLPSPLEMAHPADSLLSAQTFLVPPGLSN